MSYVNSDLKTWNVGVVISRSPNNRNYHIKTENDQVISRNRVHLHETYVKFVPHRYRTFQKFQKFEGGENS